MLVEVIHKQICLYELLQEVDLSVEPPNAYESKGILEEQLNLGTGTEQNRKITS